MKLTDLFRQRNCCPPPMRMDSAGVLSQRLAVVGETLRQTVDMVFANRCGLDIESKNIVDLRTAYQLLSSRPESDHDRWPFATEFTITVDQHGEQSKIVCDGWAIWTAAAASYSGQLEQAESNDNLNELIEQTRKRIEIGELRLTDLEDEFNRVLRL